MECCYCKKIYSSVYTLKNHQKTTRSCITIQKELGLEVKTKLFECTYCKKDVTTKTQLDSHYTICKKKLKEDMKKEIEKKMLDEKEDEIQEVSCFFRNQQEELEFELKRIIHEKEQRIKELEQRIERDEKQPRSITKNKNITNHITNNYLTIYQVMTPQSVANFFEENYKFENLLGGIPALANFIYNGFIAKKVYYLCSDKSRLRFNLLDEEGNIIEDTNCHQLLSLTGPGMLHIKNVYEYGLFLKHINITENDIHMSYKPISELDRDTTQFKQELSKILPSEKSKPINEEWRKPFVEMREALERNRKCDKEAIATSKLVQNTIGGVSLGSLQKYKEGYQKRKRDANGAEVDIRVPKELVELLKTDDNVKKQYIDFICS
jgi:hypothetical protein